MSPYGDRELDVRVAEALGWKWFETVFGKRYIHKHHYLMNDRPIQEASEEIPLWESWDKDLPRFRTDPTAFVGLLEEMRGRGFGFTISGEGGAFLATIARDWPSKGLWRVGATTIGEAVCRAVIAALSS